MVKYNGQAEPYQIVPRRPGDVPLYFGAPALAESLLGWYAKRGLSRIELCKTDSNTEEISIMENIRTESSALTDMGGGNLARRILLRLCTSAHIGFINVQQFEMAEIKMKNQTYLTRLPFNSGDGVLRYCVEGAMTDAPGADGIFSVATPGGTVSPGYCVDCMGDLGGAELVYGAGAQKCMHCGSVFLHHHSA